MNSTSFALPMILSGILAQLPLLAISLLAIIVSMVRWKDVPAASRWTLASSLLSVLICLGIPVSQGLMTIYLRQAGLTGVTLGYYYSGVAFLWAALRAVSIGFLLVAVYTGRRALPGPGVFPPSPGYYPPVPGR